MQANSIATLGSLFDGVGAVPYAASFFGIKTLWASEILPNAISVTRRHFPKMEHLGDITKLDGGKIPPVDIIAFGSPCQSWSVAAGNRTGLAGKSGLFMEAIRIIREMRKATNGKYPQIALFENVVGLLSCRAGGRSDYQAVLEAFTEAEIPMPKSGRWANAGMVRGHGIDFAWIVKDSQYHRTAQRRKRLFAIVDYRGQRAGEILFVSQSLQGYFAARERARERTAAALESGAGGTGGESIVYGICSDKSNSMLSGNPHSGVYEAETCRTLDQNCGNPGCNQGGMAIVEPQLARTLTARHDSSPCADRGQNVVAVSSEPMIAEAPPNAVTMRLREGCAGGGKGPLIQTEKSGTLATGNDQYLFCADKRKADDLCAYGFDLQQITSKTNRSQLKEVQPVLCSAGRPHVVISGEGDDKRRQVHPDVSGTLCASGAGLSRPAGNANETDLCVTYCLQGNMIGRQDKNGPQGCGVNTEKCFTVSAADHHAIATFIRQRSDSFTQGDLASTQTARQYKDATDLVCHAATVDCRNFRESCEISGTLQSKCTGGYSLNYQNPVRTGYIVRRLTPTEAERLMSFEDGWTRCGHDGKLMSDSARYQMCGNSIVVNCLAYIMQNVAEHIKNGKDD